MLQKETKSQSPSQKDWGRKEISLKKRKKKQWSDLRKVQLKKESEKERSSFRSKEVARVTAYKNSKRNTPISSTTAVSKNPLENPYRNRQLRKDFESLSSELPHSPRKQRAVVSGRIYYRLSHNKEIEIFFFIRHFLHNAWCK